MGMDRFVVWGIGERGKIITDFLGESQIIAYIDSDETKQGTNFMNRPVIGLTQYLEKYHEYFIIVTPVDEELILELLKKNEIKRYFRMSHLPSEMQGYGDLHFMDKIEIPARKSGKILILGMTLYSLFLYKKIVDKGYDNVYMQTGDQKEFAELMQYGFGCRFTSDIDYEKDYIILSTPEYVKIKSHSEGNILDLFDVADRIEQYYVPEVKKFQNFHRGERCFIIATGPSLKEDDLRVLTEHGETCIGVNRVFNVDEKVWKPQYYIFADRKGMEEYWEKIVSYDASEKFLGDSYWKDMPYKGNIYRVHAVTGHSFAVMPSFSENIEQKVYAYGTVTYVAIQLAVYMGFSTIYLLGVDCNYMKNGKDNYFFEEQKEDKVNHHVDRMHLAYRSARLYTEAKGIKILNASRGGSLEEFERVNFDEIFREKE